jgi:hypothetical protein
MAEGAGPPHRSVINSHKRHKPHEEFGDLVTFVARIFSRRALRIQVGLNPPVKLATSLPQQARILLQPNRSFAQ